MNKIEKPVKIGYYAIIEDDYDSVNKTKTTHNEIAGFVNKAIEQSDKYWEQEIKKKDIEIHDKQVCMEMLKWANDKLKQKLLVIKKCLNG